MLDMILRAQGYRTGRYTSPHLIRFNERMQINGELIGDDELLELIGEVEEAAATLPGQGLRDVTFFEFTTAIAFLYFQRRGAEVAVIETGMGGRLDATNVVIPAVSVITSIGFDHMAYLGGSLEKIAGEKAGIIKSGRPIVTGELPEDADRVVAGVAHEKRAPLIVAADHVSVAVKDLSWEGQTLDISSEQQSYGRIKTHLPGKHQASNTAVVIAVAETLNSLVGMNIGTDAIKSGISGATWPARGQLLSDDPPVVLDGAHNVEAAEALASWLKKVAGRRPVGFVVGFLADKEPEAFMKVFAAMARYTWVVPIHSERAMPTEDIMKRLAFLPGIHPMPDLASGLEQARAWARAEGGVVVITGSLYLAGEVLAGWKE